jgi:hypothetical protein
MHPVEHVVCFSAVILYWVIPAHPLHSIFSLQHLALEATLAHHGFHRVILGKQLLINTDHYTHYLHHKYVRANYGGDIVPIDKWMGGVLY